MVATFGNLTLVKETEPRLLPCGLKQRRFLCICNCGKTTNVSRSHLVSGHTKSCGCLKTKTRIKINLFQGQRFGRLRIVLEGKAKLYPQFKVKQRHYLCQCDCGNWVRVAMRSLLNGDSKSCGCLRIETTIKRATKHNHKRGRVYSSIYNSWTHMLSRCRNPKEKQYKDYGGRGIRVCNRWHDFQNFLADMGEKPKGKSLDRIDVDGNYEPQNCRWADAKTQRRNQRKKIFVSDIPSYLREKGNGIIL